MNKKIIWKFNIIDLLIIAILLFSLTALIYRMTWGSSGDEQNFEITYICDEAPIELLRDIRSGEKCSDGDMGTDLGSVTGVYSAAITDNLDKGRASVRATVTAALDEHGIKIGDTVYLKGKKINLIIGNSIFEVYISDIVETE